MICKGDPPNHRDGVTSGARLSENKYEAQAGLLFRGVGGTGLVNSAEDLP